MPWYGESRSLMAEIQHLVAADEQELGLLKLMVVYRNSEKLLTDVIGATEGIKFIYYQDTVPFKYHGKLRAQDILSSVRYILSLKQEEAPFEVLHTKEDVEAFIESTDKSVLLYESCRWFFRLAHGGSNQSDEAASSKNHTQNVDISGKTLTRESDGPLELVIEDEELTFGGGGQFSPWKGGFTLANESVSDQIENTNDGKRNLCTAQKFHQFESFYAKLTAIAREYLQPPERVRFGIVTERSSLPSLDVVSEVNNETWFTIIHYLGCTTCSIIVKEGDDLRSIVQSHHNLDIKEVDVDGSGGEAIFPANRPSVILFIDRLSHSSKIRDESKLSLKLLRQYVLNNYPFHSTIGALSSSTSRMHSRAAPLLMKRGISDAHSETARLNAWASKLMALGDKMSVMVLNDGESISYRSSSQGSGGNPLYDILTKLLHKTGPGHRLKKTRISLVTKDVGLKLLSDDSKIQVVESLSVQGSEHERTDDSFATSDNVNDDIAEVSVDENKATETEYIDDGQAPSMLEKTPATYSDKDANNLESNVIETEDQSEGEVLDMSSDLQEEVSYDVYSSSEVGGILHKHKKEKTVEEALDILEPDDRNIHIGQKESRLPNEQDDVSSVLGKNFRRIEDVIYDDNSFNLDEGSEESDRKCPSHATCSSSSSSVRDGTEQVISTISDDRFAGSFYFSDGGYRLLRTLTGGSRVPSLVIIDPVQEKHFVFPEEDEFIYASLQNYFDSFMNQSLPSYHHAASSAISSKELPRPPFVNHDFHEANSIPQLTTNSFCALVFGFRGCDSKNEVSFSNTENVTSGWNKDVLVLFSNSWCGFCQRAELVVRELHRSFTSFMSYSDSAFANAQDLHVKEKNEEYSMKGFPAIYTIDCTSNECHHLLKSAGMEEAYPTLLLFPAENKSAVAYEGGMSVANLIEFLESRVRNSHHLLEYKGFLWKKKMATKHDAPQAIQFHIDDKSSSSVGYGLPIHSDVVTGSILMATEKLGTAVPFDNSRVLIVSADSQEGFIGLIINKRLSWAVFKNLDSSMEPIKHAPLFYGGPVVVQGYHLVSLSRVAWEGYVQVTPGVYYGSIIATSRVITRIKSGEQSAEDLWFFLGYSGWGYSQLFDELSEGSWHVSGKPIEHLDWPES
uniref:Thioredoxin domain-containing protein n=1 Tax=Arundo donax TaxID=35708 RepID=A0A0A9D176_ARUDO